MDPLTRLVVIVMCVLSWTLGMANARPGQGVTTVTLRSTARLAPDTPLVLGSIASIEGDQAALLETLPIGGHTPVPDAWTTVSADTVRDLIDRSPAHAGSVVVVGPGADVIRLRARAETTAEPAPSREPDPGVITVRDHIGSWLRSRFRAAPDAIRVAYPDRAGSVLNTPTDGRVVSITEIGFSSRIALRVDVYEQDTLVLTDTVRAGVQVRRESLVVARPVRRGGPLRETDVRRELSWIDPTDPPAPPASAIGLSLLRSLQPGQIVREHHLRSPSAIERGQDVSVRTVHGSVVVTTFARARHDAREGELVELETRDRTRRRFTARVAGPGRAVMVDAAEAAAAIDPEDTPPELSVGTAQAPTEASPSITISDSPQSDAPPLQPIRRDTLDLKPIRNTRR